MAKPDKPPGKPDEPGIPDHAGKPESPGQSERSIVMSVGRTTQDDYVWAARERITVSNTAVGFTAATYKPTSGDYKGICARIAKFTVESADIRYCQDGTTATTSVGKVIYETGGDTILGTQNIKKFSAIRDGSTDATIDVEYGW